jgi:hypothetical protein
VRSAPFLALASVVALGSACPPATTSPACSSQKSCPTGQACVDGSCLSLSQLSRSFAALVIPSDADLVPQEYLGIDPSRGAADFTLDLPASLDATLPIPATCSPGEALPLQVLVTRHPILPVSPATFSSKSSLAGIFSCALPPNERIDLALTTALPCAGSGVQRDQILLGGPIDPSTLTFLPPDQSLTIIGTLSAVGVAGGAVGALAGASVTALAAAGPRVGKAISPTVLTQPSAAECGPSSGPCSTVGFVLPVQLADVMFDGGGCVPSTDPASCRLDGGCPFSPCATLVLEVGPSAADGGRTLATMDFVVRHQITPVDPSGNAGLSAGPTLSLMGDDGLGIHLPIGPGSTFVHGIVVGNNDMGVIGALTELRSTNSLEGCVGQPLVATDPTGATLCSYTARALTDQSGSGQFTMEAPPGTYTLTVFPPASQPDLAPRSTAGFPPIIVPADGGPASQQPFVTLPPATAVSGRAVDPTGRPLSAGVVRVLPLNSEQLIGTTSIDSHGNFSLPVAPTTDSPDVILLDPPLGLGLAVSSQIVSVPKKKPLYLGDQPVSVGVPLSGAVFAQTLDGSRRPVASASVRFYLLYANGAQLAVAIPVATGVTDAVGRYSVVVPNVPPQ